MDWCRRTGIKVYWGTNTLEKDSSGGNCTLFGKWMQPKENKSYSVKFKITSRTVEYTADNAVALVPKENMLGQYIQDCANSYGYASNGTVYFNKEEIKTVNKYAMNDIVELIYSPKTAALTAKVNNGKEFVLLPAGTIISVKYKFGISLNDSSDQIQILSLSEKELNIDNDDDDSKCSKCDKLNEEIQSLQAQIIDLKKEKNNVVNENEQITYSLQQRIAELEKTEKEKENKNKELQQKIANIEGEKAEIQQKYNDVNSVNVKLNDECKELQMNLNDMTQKYNKLYRKNNIKESDYKNWDSDMITDWIITLDAEYEEYEEKLRRNMKKEQVDGSLLGILEKNDLHRFGIIPLKHKHAIIQRIKKLTTEKQSLPQNNEGNNITAYI